MAPHIVVVDDEADIIEGLKEVLQMGLGDVRVTGCISPAHALEVMRDHPADVLWTDYRMPEMDGIELAGHARRLQPGLRVVIFTAADNVRPLAQPHGYPVLAKTVGAAAIVARARDLLPRATVVAYEREERREDAGRVANA